MNTWHILISVTVLATVLQVTYQDTTIPPTTHHHHHHTGPTREPSEHDTYKFAYEPTSHHMVMVKGHTCYIASLTDAERISVHTDTGITQIELKLLTLLSSGTLTATSVDSLSKAMTHRCGHNITQFYTVV